MSFSAHHHPPSSDGSRPPDDPFFSIMKVSSKKGGRPTFVVLFTLQLFAHRIKKVFRHSTIVVAAKLNLGHKEICNGLATA